MIYKVKNLNTHRPVPKGYSYWIDYWEYRSGQKVKKCHRSYCNKPAEDGTHVKLGDSNNQSWYIVPLCHKHNMKPDEEFYVDGPLVPVDSEGKILW